MDWNRAVDGYCERVGPEYWAEPINALTNLAFIAFAFVMWHRATPLPMARLLCAILFCIGVGSFLFHTHARVWAGAADVAPILIFILVYLFALNRDGLKLGTWAALGATALFLPYVAALGTVFARLPWMGASAGYAPIPILILLYALFLRHRAPELARGLVIGAGLLVVSLTIRTLDTPLCSALPSGTHFVWHVINAALLAWMIEVYLRARLGKTVAER